MNCSGLQQINIRHHQRLSQRVSVGNVIFSCQWEK